MTNYTIRSNRTTNHIAGLEAVLAGEFTLNHCGTLTRSRLAEGKTVQDVAEALRLARIVGGRKVCKTCEKVAEAMIAAAETVETVDEAPATQVKVIWRSEITGQTGERTVTSEEEAKSLRHLYHRVGLAAIVATV